MRLEGLSSLACRARSSIRVWGRRRGCEKRVCCFFVTLPLTSKTNLHFTSIHLCACAQLRPDFCNVVDCNQPGSSVLEDFPSKNTGVVCHALLQEIFPTQGSSLSLPHYRKILCYLSHPYTSVCVCVCVCVCV